jgi:hypothetical protein
MRSMKLVRPSTRYLARKDAMKPASCKLDAMIQDWAVTLRISQCYPRVLACPWTSSSDDVVICRRGHTVRELPTLQQRESHSSEDSSDNLIAIMAGLFEFVRSTHASVVQMAMTPYLADYGPQEVRISWTTNRLRRRAETCTALQRGWRSARRSPTIPR